jgi:hypothetical protein
MHYAYNLARDLITLSPFKGYFAALFQTSLFRCGASGTVVGLSLILMLGVMLHAQRAKAQFDRYSG